jgi:hypothetical protein
VVRDDSAGKSPGDWQADPDADAWVRPAVGPVLFSLHRGSATRLGTRRVGRRIATLDCPYPSPAAVYCCSTGGRPFLGLIAGDR